MIATKDRVMSASESQPTPPDKPAESDSDQALRLVREALRGLKYGNIVIVVQDGTVVQVDRTEKRRIQRGRDKLGASESAE